MMYEGFQLFEKRKRGAYLIRQNGLKDCFFKQLEDGIYKKLRMQSRKAQAHEVRGKMKLNTFKYGAKLVKTLMVHSQSNTHESSCNQPQHAKKVVSNSLGLVDFAIRLVTSVFNLLDGQVMFFEELE